ncbi:MAG: 50S ribosomal protein L11 methyltransferase [Anaerolineae bacterium]
MIDPRLVLRRRPSLSLEIDLYDHVHITVDNVRFLAGRYALAIHDTFAQPKTVKEGTSALSKQVTGLTDWTELMNDLYLMIDIGALVTNEQAQQPLIAKDSYGFASATGQASMLNDRLRTEQYIRAIKQMVRPGDVVVEIGTGTGVLSVAAAQAGASRVYAIEASSIAELATEVFAANQVDDRVQIIRGNSTHVTLQEKADVLISEILGNDPFGEGLLKYINDGLHRFIKPGARCIPQQLKVYALLLEMPPMTFDTYMFNEWNTARWQEWYGIDFAPLRTAVQTISQQAHFYGPQIAAWKRLSKPVLLTDLRLDRENPLVFSVSPQVEIIRSGRLNTVALYFTADLAEGISLTNAIADREVTPNWNNAAWVLGNPVNVEPGDQYMIDYRVNTSSEHMSVRRADA